MGYQPLEVINEKAHYFNILHACELLPGPANGSFERITLKTATVLSFPSSDLRVCELENNHLTISLNLLGLYGVDSPLAYDDLLALMEGSEQRRSLIDIFHTELYQQLYLSWKRHHIFSGKILQKYYDKINALSGDRLNGFPASYAMPLSHKTPTCQGLVSILDDYLQDIPVSIIDFCPRWISLTERPFLGGGMRLNDNAVLGERVFDCSQTISITLGPASLDDLMAWFPEAIKGQSLVDLIKLYLNYEYDFNLRFEVSVPKDVLRLGCDPIMLGQYSWIGQA